MVAPSGDDDGLLISPKWLVAAMALGVEGLLLSYDLRLGLAGSAVLGVVVAVWLYVALRYGSLSGTPSNPNAMAARARLQDSSRRIPARASRPEQGADPSERP